MHKQRIPIIVNIPHVPPIDDSDGSSQRALDVLIDDLIGRVRTPRMNNGSDDDEVEPDDSNKPEVDISDMEHRLDEVRHQGELDQLAVKSALLKKLIVRVTSAGLDRNSMFGDAIAIVLKASPRHLAKTITAFFGDSETRSAF